MPETLSGGDQTGIRRDPYGFSGSSSSDGGLAPSGDSEIPQPRQGMCSDPIPRSLLDWDRRRGWAVVAVEATGVQWRWWPPSLQWSLWHTRSQYTTRRQRRHLWTAPGLPRCRADSPSQTVFFPPDDIE